MMNLLSTLASADLSSLQQPPMATILILLLSVSINLVIGFLGRRSMDVDEYRRIMGELASKKQILLVVKHRGHTRYVILKR